ncbi:MAG: hypothetical protein GY909_15870 [Oligoflexia bacterium]|nr:hypothetical protein [Oligoflexia bacterium]
MNNVIEASQNTYIQLVDSYCDDNIKDELIEKFVSKMGRFKSVKMPLSKLRGFYKTHPCQYDDERSMREQINQLDEMDFGVVYDPSLDSYLIVDGNHRTNTFAQNYPNKLVTVIVFEGEIPKELRRYID